MSDEAPRDEHPANGAPADPGAPTEETAAAAGPPAAPPPPGGAPQERDGFYVSRRVAAIAAAVVGVLVLFFGGFAIGHATGGDGDHGRERAAREAPGREGGGDNEGRQGGGDGEGRPTSGVFLGVATRDATGSRQGAEVAQVVSGSPAAQAGLQDGDVITAVDGSNTTNAAELAWQVRSHQSGDQLTLTYSRAGNSAQTQVTLGTRSSPSSTTHSA